MLKIGLDYDETFTADPVLWGQFIALVKLAGHEVKFVTYRSPKFNNDDICSDASECKIDVIFTSGRQKCNFYDADIWIDDSPVTIPSATDLGNFYDRCLVNDDMK